MTGRITVGDGRYASGRGAPVQRSLPAEFAGRRIIETTLDPIPRLLRARPGCIAMNSGEIARLRDGCGATFKRMMAIVRVEDFHDLRRGKRRSVNRGRS